MIQNQNFDPVKIEFKEMDHRIEKSLKSIDLSENLDQLSNYHIVQFNGKAIAFSKRTQSEAEIQFFENLIEDLENLKQNYFNGKTILQKDHPVLNLSGGSNQTPSLSSDSSKFSAGSKAKGAAKRDFARRQAGKNPVSSKSKSKSSGSIFAKAFTVEPKFPARPGRNRDGLFSRFAPKPTPDPHNPGCGGGPKSIKVLSGQRNPNSSREMTCHDGVKCKLTDKSASHLTSKHGHEVGIDDPLPTNPNQKPKLYKQVRTRINNANTEKFGDIVEGILNDPNTEPFPVVRIRGIKSRVYYTEDYGKDGFLIGIHTEGEFTGQIKKAQSVTPEQLQKLRKFKSID